VAKALDKTSVQVIAKANALHIGLTRETTTRLVNSAARRYMKSNNPMHRPEVVRKVSTWRKTTSEGKAVTERLIIRRAEFDRTRPSSLERKLGAMLIEMGVSYEPSFFIKPNFIVDFRIGNLIIEADGDWWHGHPKFEPLRLRQISQRRKDAARDAYLTKFGYAVVRIWESDLTIELLERILSQHQDALSVL
jgi:very-short-patch-repair endonuclease